MKKFYILLLFSFMIITNSCNKCIKCNYENTVYTTDTKTKIVVDTTFKTGETEVCGNKTQRDAIISKENVVEYDTIRMPDSVRIHFKVVSKSTCAE